MTLNEVTEWSLNQKGDRMVLLFDEKEYRSFALYEQSLRLKRGFQSLGVKKSERVLVCMINDPIVNPVFNAVFRLGAIVTPVMFQLTEEEIRFILQDIEAVGIITEERLLPKIRGAAEGIPSIRWIVANNVQQKENLLPGEYDLKEMAQQTQDQSVAHIQDDDLALILYTSGTTGLPKGVMLSHGNLTAAAKAIGEFDLFGSWGYPVRSVSALPMAHMAGIISDLCYAFIPPEVEACGIQLPWFDAERCLELIERYQATHFNGVPSMLAMLMSHPRLSEFDCSSLKLIAMGASPLPGELARKAMDHFQCAIRNTYGMTETAGVIAGTRRTEPFTPGSVGRSAEGMSILIADDLGNPVPKGAAGEILVYGPNVMGGYWKRPEITAQTLKNGWLHTGDIGYLDANENLHVIDRKKDMIIKGGENVFPAEIERLLYGIEGVAEASVLGVPNEIYGEEIIAAIRLKHGAHLSAEDIRRHLQPHLTKFKIPSAIHFMEEIPKTNSGKIMKPRIRQLLGYASLQKLP